MNDEEMQSVLHDLADIIWWMKGYQAAKGEDSSQNDLGNEHIEALRKVRLYLKENIDQKGTPEWLK